MIFKDACRWNINNYPQAIYWWFLRSKKCDYDFMIKIIKQSHQYVGGKSQAYEFHI